MMLPIVLLMKVSAQIHVFNAQRELLWLEARFQEELSVLASLVKFRTVLTVTIVTILVWFAQMDSEWLMEPAKLILILVMFKTAIIVALLDNALTVSKVILLITVNVCVISKIVLNA